VDEEENAHSTEFFQYDIVHDEEMNSRFRSFYEAWIEYESIFIEDLEIDP
jgi:hypothetical protein